MRVLTDGQTDFVGLDRAIYGYVTEKENGLVDDSNILIDSCGVCWWADGQTDRETEEQKDR